MGHGVFRVRGGDAWVDGCREAVGWLIKGKPGISGTRAWRSHGGDRGGSLLHGRGARRKEEADERARHVSERGRGALGELCLVGGPGVA